MRVYLIGFMGAGKTYWGKKLSQKMQLPFFDLDDEKVKKLILETRKTVNLFKNKKNMNDP